MFLKVIDFGFFDYIRLGNVLFFLFLDILNFFFFLGLGLMMIRIGCLSLLFVFICGMFFFVGNWFYDVVGSVYYVVLEVLKKKLGFEFDVWSIGVIIYILFCGWWFFWDKIEKGIFDEVCFLIVI